MKKIYIVFIGLLMSQINLQAQIAQGIDTSTIEGLYKYVYKNLDKSQIPTQYLMDYGMPLVPLDTISMNNSTQSTADTFDFSMFKAIHSTLFTTYVGTGTNQFATQENLAQKIEQSKLNFPSSIIAPVELATFNVFKPDAVVNNLLSIQNRQILDVPGRTQSPYNTLTLFAASIEQDGVVGNNSLVVPSLLFLGNEIISNFSLSIDFGTVQGFVPVTLDVPITFSYSTPGIKTVTLKVTRNSDSKTWFSHSKIIINEQTSSIMRMASSGEANFTMHPTAQDDGAEIHIWYGQNNSGQLRKPLIVFKGWDAGDIEALEGLADRTNAESFLQTLKFDISGNTFDEHLTDIDSYDLIFVDYNNSLDDIRRNAHLAERVIDWVNANKLTSEKNVVMGISMGGLVARYALADMTKRGKATHTRLLITHDSPHKGANIPLGIQHFLRMFDDVVFFGQHVRKFFAQYDDVISLLDQPASQQMLIYRAVDKTNSVQNTFINSIYQPMVTFQSYGPQPEYQFIATSQGSECGQQLFAPYKSLISANGSAGVIIPILFGFHSRLIARFEVNALPSQGSTNRIAYFNLTWKNKLAFFITVQKVSYEYSAYAPGYQLPIDGAPGGIPPSIEDVDGNLNDKIFIPFVGSFYGLAGLFGGYVNIRYSVNNPQIFAFVPTASALDISPFNTAALTAKYNGGFNPYFKSSANDYIAQQTEGSVSNIGHVYFTQRNASWLLSKMRGIPTTLNCSPCSSLSTYYTINGESTFCGSASYSLNLNLSANATISWNLSNPSFTLTSNGSNATVNTNGNSGSANLVATINTSCGNFSITKYISTSTQPSSWGITINRISTSNYGMQAYEIAYNGVVPYSTEMQLENGTPPTYFEFQTSSGIINSMTPFTPSGKGFGFIYNLDYNPPSVVNIRYKNQCGFSEWRTFEVYRRNGGWYYRISPNPSSSVLSISLDESQIADRGMATASVSRTQQQIPTFDQVVITDITGNIKLRQNVRATQNAQINISGLPNGIYYLNLYSNGKIIEKKTIQVAK